MLDYRLHGFHELLVLITKDNVPSLAESELLLVGHELLHVDEQSLQNILMESRDQFYFGESSGELLVVKLIHFG